MRLLLAFVCIASVATTACDGAEPDPMVERLALRCTTDLVPDPERVATLLSDLDAIGVARGERPIDVAALLGESEIVIEAPAARIEELMAGEEGFDRINARLGGVPSWDGVHELVVSFARVYADEALAKLYAEATNIDVAQIAPSEGAIAGEHIAFDVSVVPHRYAVTRKGGVVEHWSVDGGQATAVASGTSALCR